MKLMIDVDEKVYRFTKANPSWNDGVNAKHILDAVRKGKPLPDIDALKKAINDAYEEYDGYDPHDLSRFAERVEDLIDNALTVNEDRDIGRSEGGFR